MYSMSKPLSLRTRGNMLCGLTSTKSEALGAVALEDAWPLRSGPRWSRGCPRRSAWGANHPKMIQELSKASFLAPGVRAALGVASKLVSKMLPSACFLFTCARATECKQPRCQYAIHTHVVLVYTECTCVDMLVYMMCFRNARTHERVT